MVEEIDMGLFRIAMQDEWLAARRELRATEEELARARAGPGTGDGA
jgi:hypothetical protein